MLCFASFATVLALIQMVCCLGLMMLSQRLAGALPVGHSQHARWRERQTAPGGILCDGLIILAALLFLVPPLLAVVIGGLSGSLLTVLTQTALWRAVFTSLSIALCAGLLYLLLTAMLLWSSRELRLRQRRLGAQLLDLSGMVILAMPGIVLATVFSAGNGQRRTTRLTRAGGYPGECADGHSLCAEGIGKSHAGRGRPLPSTVSGARSPRP
ncbi:hypothetical protein SODG_007137 [Sodalis praecaptivus]